MIHACPERMWYVAGHLLPALITSGIGPKQIKIWNDDKHRGNLLSCMDSFRFCARYGTDTWHIQDDVLPCRDFADRLEELDDEDGVLCGFGCGNFTQQSMIRGTVYIAQMWWSFPCIRIPDQIAGECAEWFFADAQHREQFREWTRENKGDDAIFKSFLLERYPNMTVQNITPCLVEHVDYLIGGTTVNKSRHSQINRAAYWEDEELVRQLEAKLKT